MATDTVKIYIIHGWDGSPEEPMLDWLKKSIQKTGVEVLSPHMPNPEKPTITAWTSLLEEIVDDSRPCIFIGHSIGCQTILRFIEKTKKCSRILGIVLIAPWMTLTEQTLIEKETRKIAEPWMEDPIDFEKVRTKVKAAVAIFSDNDPYILLDQADLFKNELGAKIIIEHNKYHFDPINKIDRLESALSEALSLISRNKNWEKKL